MGLDVRLPIGLMFAIMGILLSGYGMLAPHAENAGLNTGWGFVMLAVGALMLWLSRRSRK
jgi:hypothetical protein